MTSQRSLLANNVPALTAWLILFLLAIQSPPLHAASATWDPNPFDGDWNNNANWTPGSAPNGSNDIATFGLSNITAIFLSANTEVDSIIFNANASAFTITASPTFTLTISGAGITNNSGNTQNFVTAVDGAGNAGTIQFTNSATAGSSTVFTNAGQTINGPSAGGITAFFDASSAGGGTFVNNSGGAAGGSAGGVSQFNQTSTAGNGNFTNTAAHSAVRAAA